MNPNNYEVQNNRGKYRKIKLIDKRGGSCEHCGYSKNLNALEFHHIEDKSFPLDSRHLSNTSWDKILTEFNKCILLCANCHRELHCPELEITLVRNNLEEQYNPDKTNERSINKCIDCNTPITFYADRCKSCWGETRQKIEYPPIPWMKSMMDKYSGVALSRRLGVSYNSIKKYISKNE